MPSSHLILCRPLLLLPPIPPSIRVFSSESTLCMRWPKYRSFSFSIIPSKEIPGLISFRMDFREQEKSQEPEGSRQGLGGRGRPVWPSQGGGTGWRGVQWGRECGAGGDSECHTTSSSKQASGIRGGEGGCLLVGRRGEGCPPAPVQTASPQDSGLSWVPGQGPPGNAVTRGGPSSQRQIFKHADGRACLTCPALRTDLAPGCPLALPGLRVPRRHSCHPAAHSTGHSL